MPGKVYFRGDSRKPEKIFAEGFRKRDRASEITYRTSGGSAGDIDPDTAVCFTRRPNVAPLFPLHDNTRYIYALYLDDSKVFDTSRLQVEDADSILALTPPANRTYQLYSDVCEVIFAQEYAADEVPANLVIAAVKCDILGRRADKLRVTYQCSGRVVRNLRCTVNPAICRRVMRILSLAVQAHAQQTPEPAEQSLSDYLL